MGPLRIENETYFDASESEQPGAPDKESKGLGVVFTWGRRQEEANCWFHFTANKF